MKIILPQHQPQAVRPAGLSYLTALWLFLGLWTASAGQLAAQPKLSPQASGTPSPHALLVCQNGTVQGWGYNGYGELGNLASSTGTPTTITGTGLTNIASVATGFFTSFAIRQDGKLLAWGDNYQGKLGIGPTPSSTATATLVGVGIPNFPATIKAVAVGIDFTVALGTDGTVWTWGQNSVGQLGAGSGVAARSIPGQITGFSAPVIAIDAGEHFAVAVCADGQVYSWGSNDYGALGQGLAIGAIQYTPSPITFPASTGTLVKIAAGFHGAMALSANHSVYTWGYNYHGTVGDGTTTDRNTPFLVAGAAGAIDIVMTEFTSCTVYANGTTKMWGDNNLGYFGTCYSQYSRTTPGPGPTFSPGVKIRGSGLMFTSVETNGVLKTWGWQPLGYPAPNTGAGGGPCSCSPLTPSTSCAAQPCPALSIAASANDICVATPVTLTATGGDGIVYNWTVNGSPLAAATTSTITVTPGVTTTYAVSSSCGTSATIVINISPDCCAREQFEANGKIIELEEATYPDFNFSPFNAPPGTTFHAAHDVMLVNDKFTLAPGSVILFDAGVSLYLDERAELVVQEGATLTASCHDMWGGLIVRSAAGGIHFNGGAYPALISHSYDGVVLEEAMDKNQIPYAVFTNASFWHNRRSLTLHRWEYGPSPNDAIINCTFDSDPHYFKAPWQAQSATDYYYSEAHIIPEGDFRDMPFTNNRFAHCQVGIWMESDLPAWFHLTNSLFEEFQVAGIGGHPHGDNGAMPPVYTPSGQVALYSWNLEGNRFHFPKEGHQPAQQACDGCFVTHHFYLTTAGVISRYPSLQATSNTFAQLHADSLTTWPAFAQLPHAGIWMTGGTPQLDRNRFYQLGIGAWDNNFYNSEVYLQQNLFLNCRSSLMLGDHRGLCGGVDATARLGCNSYVRNDGGGRAGNMEGIRAALCNQATLENPYDGSTGFYLLKEKFAVLNNSPAVVPIVNQGSQVLRYLTFDNYKAGIQSACTVAGPYGINISITGPGTTNPSNPVNATPGVNTCAEDNFTNTGIQSRAASTPTKTRNKLSAQAIALEQNVPNPAGTETSIVYQLPGTVHQAALVIRESFTGREVLRQQVEAAQHEIHLNLRKLPNGIYLYTIEADGVLTKTRRLVVNH